MSSLNSNVEPGDGKELIRFEIVPDASIINGQFTIHVMKQNRHLIKGLVTVMYTIFNN